MMLGRKEEREGERGCDGEDYRHWRWLLTGSSTIENGAISNGSLAMGRR